MVFVFPGMFPATIRVAPNSPIALAKERTVPATMPFFARGSTTRRAVSNSEWPKVSEALMRLLSTDSIAALVVLIISGRATTKEARTAAYQVNMIPHPVQS